MTDEQDSNQPEQTVVAREDKKASRAKLGLEPKMLELLVCPLTHGRLMLDVEKSELISAKAKLAYPVRGGIPIMLPSEAREMDEDELAAYPS